MPTLDEIIKCVDPILKPEGFRHRSKRNWFFKSQEVTQRVHLEKSSFSNKNWMACYLTLPRMDASSVPEFGITLFVDQIVDNQDVLARALDQDDNFLSGEERTLAIRVGVGAHLIPVLRRLRTEADVLNFYLTKKSRREFFMNAKTARFLGIWDFYSSENSEMEKRQAAYVARQAIKRICDP
jgi:hypothetical protein